MSVTVIYSTEGFLHRNNGEPGTDCERVFASIEEAKAAPLPDGYTSAFSRVECVCYFYSKTWGWEFHIEFTDAERAYLSEMRALARDERGREVLIGLSMEETIFYQTHIRRRAEGNRDRDRNNQARFNELHQKHERERLQVVALGAKHAPRH